MNNFMQIFPLIELSISSAVIFVWLIQKISPKILPSFVKIFLVLLIGNILFWPLGLELPLVAYIRGVTGDLSIVLTLLLWSSLLPGSKPLPIACKLAIALIAIGFYPFALGLGMIDPYAWGYGSIIFLFSVIAFALICALASWTKGVWIIAIAIIAWSVHWHESSNLWDYLLDPLLVIWIYVDLISMLYGRRKNKARSGYLFRPG
ncbi:hypothetical protein [Polynucleobacter necessarius]|uniref:hypothetical protein n=1 Tax=Polynucleobacter necessarius TaxID=576610 RepID=UPI000E09979A|nr:hypothetical protein [Polynucleobacter necessarius]